VLPLRKGKKNNPEFWGRRKFKKQLFSSTLKILQPLKTGDVQKSSLKKKSDNENWHWRFKVDLMKSKEFIFANLSKNGQAKHSTEDLQFMGTFSSSSAVEEAQQRVVFLLYVCWILYS